MYKKKAHLHFVGIGGIGMSGIATILKYQGYTISGCDADMHQKSINDLKHLGCKIYEGNNTNQCNDTSIDILVYSSAIKQNNPEIIAAQKRGIPTIGRALMLAELMRTKYSIAIAGAHGKTTTTSLISHILIEAKKDPTVIIGGHLTTISSNARYGGGDFLVAEADESDRSFLSLHATLAIVTNIDLEHLETYTDLDDIKNTFRQFLNNLPFYGKAILCTDNPNVQSLLPLPHLKTIKYGLDQTHADLFATDIVLAADHSTFLVHKKDAETLGSITFSMPGEHNICNALAAIALSMELEIPFQTIAHALKHFGGIDRRFTFKGIYQGAEIYDDYGHHPEEIRNTLIVARKRTQGKLIVLFQPHRYTRTQKLWDSFIETFYKSTIDHLIITDIYPASESPISEITAFNLVTALRQRITSFPIEYAPFQPNFAAIRMSLSALAQPGDLILLLGAGKINTISSLLCPINQHSNTAKPIHTI
jgi:UDP-N-acetylmuramate--alanine ligase